MRAVFAVGYVGRGYPYEVWALYASQREARRHADGAAYTFGVFTLPVYEDYREVPWALRPPWKRGIRLGDRTSDEIELTADALMDGEVDVVEPGPVLAIVDLHPPEPQELLLLFTNAAAADAYLQVASDCFEDERSEAMRVYASYDDCPADRRYAAPGPPISQRVHPR